MISRFNSHSLTKMGKTSIHHFTENMNKELFVSIMEKYLKEIETMVGKTLSWYKIMILNIQAIKQKSFTKSIVKI